MSYHSLELIVPDRLMKDLFNTHIKAALSGLLISVRSQSNDDSLLSREFLRLRISKGKNLSGWVEAVHDRHLQVHDYKFVDSVRTIRVLTLAEKHFGENIKSLFAISSFINLYPLIPEHWFVLTNLYLAQVAVIFIIYLKPYLFDTNLLLDLFHSTLKVRSRWIDSELFSAVFTYSMVRDVLLLNQILI